MMAEELLCRSFEILCFLELKEDKWMQQHLPELQVLLSHLDLSIVPLQRSGMGGGCC